MKSLICFHGEDRFIHSEDYVLHRCGENQSVTDFLRAFESEDLKIVQVNFEFESRELFGRQKKLYPSDKASVFVLKQFELLSREELFKRRPCGSGEIVFNSLEEKGSFIQKVNFIKDEIAKGRLYQVNLTAPLAGVTRLEPSEIFRLYFEKFAGRYKALLPLNEYDLISFSPELFLRKISSRLITQPIKGSLSQNSNFGAGLLENQKEEAELSMIVDLLRNDLNRLSGTSSAVVTKHRAPMDLGYIQHTYSEIEIETDCSLPGALTAAAPGGSISGCPKIESLKLISEVETYKRQAYTGTLGWWKGSEFELNLTIRSFMKYKNDLYYHAGCGIVFDSDPEKEWNEFLLKTGSLDVR